MLAFFCHAVSDCRMGQLKGLNRKEGMLSLSTTKFRQAECSELLYPRPPHSTESAGEFSVIANILPLSSLDIAPFVSCVVDMQHKTCHRTFQTQSSVLTSLCGLDLLQ